MGPRPYQRVQRGAVQRWRIFGAANDGATPENDVLQLTLDDPPTRDEQAKAWHEIIYGLGRLTVADIEGIATEANEADGGSPCMFPSPYKRANALKYSLRKMPDLPQAGLFLPPNIVMYRPDADERAEGFVVSHETGHGLAPSYALHADVARIALALTLPRDTVEMLVKRYGVQGAIRAACARYRYAPRTFIRLRIERVILGM